MNKVDQGDAPRPMKFLIMTSFAPEPATVRGRPLLGLIFGWLLGGGYSLEGASQIYICEVKLKSDYRNTETAFSMSPSSPRCLNRSP
ncbi:hypothetical protein RSAG8_12048, partial [Rhizoctonia solani AG-8 WAC10335]